MLKSPSQRSNPQPHAQPPAVLPQTNFVPDEPRPRFFVQPPTNEENTRQSNLILPVSRPPVTQPVAVVAPVRQTAQAVRTNRQPRQRSQVRAQPAPPTVDIDSYREYADDIDREDIRITPQVCNFLVYFIKKSYKLVMQYFK